MYKLVQTKFYESYLKEGKLWTITEYFDDGSASDIMKVMDMKNGDMKKQIHGELGGKIKTRQVGTKKVREV